VGVGEVHDRSSAAELEREEKQSHTRTSVTRCEWCGVALRNEALLCGSCLFQSCSSKQSRDLVSK
jgi:hypothetical protein